MHTHKYVSISVSFFLYKCSEMFEMCSGTAGGAEGDDIDAQGQSRPDSEASAVNDVVNAAATDSHNISDRNVSSLAVAMYQTDTSP